MRYRTLADGTVVSALALGTIPFGTTLDDRASFAILDRFVEAGGTAIDTANSYAFWEPGGTGGESEATIGRWLAARGCRDQVVLATKCGARPRQPGTGLENAEGLSAKAVKPATENSLRRLQTDHLDVLWAHIEDRSVPVEETVEALAGLVSDGTTRILGASNHATWRVERARALAGDGPRYTQLQYRYSYLQPRPGLGLPQGGHVHASAELLDYATAEPDLTLWVYTALLEGAYTRTDKPLPPAYDHPGTTRRRALLREVAGELGATPNQVVLGWLMESEMIPIIGVSSVGQLDELLETTTTTMVSNDLRLRLQE